jgi:hypothetical protein
MEYLFERFQINSIQLRSEVEHVITVFSPMRNFIENNLDLIVGDPSKPNEYTIGLDILQKNEVITYTRIQQRKSELLYNVRVINRYNLELLNVELHTLRTIPDRLLVDRAIPLPHVPNVTYYDLRSGEIIINGKVNTLRKTNKKLFDALFIAHPERASRNELLKIIGVTRTDKSRKIALNDAFSNLRSACGVKARIITLNDEGGRLNGRAYQLSIQLAPKIINR